MAQTISVGSRGQFAMLVSDEDYDFLIRWRWSFARSHPREHGGRRELIYARRSARVAGDPLWTEAGPVAAPKRKFDLFVHHVILARMGYPEPPEPGWTADHENGETLDNQRPNLRWASRRYQANNQRDRRHSQRVIEALAAMAPTHTLPYLAPPF